MAEHDDGLLAIEVDADDYAQTAAEDTAAVSRTYQSEADFQAIKTTYSAKVDGGGTYKDLIAAVPELDKDFKDHLDVTGGPTIKLAKKDVQLLGYAVGELYYDKQFLRIVELCSTVTKRCEVDGKTAESLKRWEKRCRERMS